ncbi:MAG: anthranilate phosphoribosyltransferase, partial [Halobacteriales archaeon]|nr:anthranilate phosphoribosyltransferase [Halobacteriales archaeon]
MSADAPIRAALADVVEGRSLSEERAYAVMVSVMRGETTASQMAGLLVALRMKGESVDEIAGFARAMRQACRAIHPRVHGRLVDTCSTGGAKLKLFNVGTTAAFLAAAAGVPIAKHGNRGVTRASGSADVLEALGADLSLGPEEVQRTIEETGIGFLFSPAFHPAMLHPLAPRREMGIRTVFNILGPLCNPADAKGQVLGVYDARLLEPLGEALLRLGTEHALVVHGDGGLDELSTIGPTQAVEVVPGGMMRMTLDAAKLGIPRARPHEVEGSDPKTNAAEARRILGGGQGPRADMVLLNAAAAIHFGGKAHSLEEGLRMARDVHRAGT